MPSPANSSKLSSGRPKIMLVDDDAALRTALSLRLRASRYEIVAAGDGFSALALAQKERPNLIVLDLGLPGGDGFLVMKNLKKIPSLSLIPVIVLSARDPQSSEERALRTGAAAFLQKPADNFELLSLIQMSLDAVSPYGTARLPS
jgi:CheY-like chemotaxis protein